MQEPTSHITVAGRKIALYQFNTIVVGSGAAGLSAADWLWKRGQTSVAVVTEGMKMGTSRNTGSDKQTYYKLSTCGDQEDSVRRMAETLASGGSMDGDLALAEAAGSLQCFFRLVNIGVPFPHNAFGEFVGYKTDHDPCKRGTSAGPLTSKFMTDMLTEEIARDGLPVFDRHQVIEILTADIDGQRSAIGALALNLDRLDEPDGRYVVFSCVNLIYATGGEAGMYESSVYPPSQTGGTGVALRAGVRGKNLTESQYGLTSLKFRWNLSGTYQQVLPRYISTDQDGGDEREFLDDYFDNPTRLLTAIFLKGYQWPFDPRKVENQGSSLIDIAVYHERVNRGRRVYLDYLHNPSCADRNGSLDFSLLEGDAKEYLENSQALLPTPIQRLTLMNPAAIELYRSNGIDLTSERLEIAVSAQHSNGGLAADKWWQSDLAHFFPIGEVNGSHGVYRPGGSALNSGQVGAMRAAEYIARMGRGEALPGDVLRRRCGEGLERAVVYGEDALTRGGNETDIESEIKTIRKRMTGHGAHIRSAAGATTALEEAKAQLAALRQPALASPTRLGALHKALDLAVCQYAYLFAIKDYINQGGGSRGSYLIQDSDGIKPSPTLPDSFTFRLDDGEKAKLVQEVWYNDGECGAEWRPVRPVPPLDDWFENVWREYKDGGVFR